jgi:hypothetical protein
MKGTKKTLPTGGGMQSGGKTLPRGKSEHLKQGGGLKTGGGMEGVHIKDEEYDDMFFESVKKANVLEATKTAVIAAVKAKGGKP